MMDKHSTELNENVKKFEARLIRKFKELEGSVDQEDIDMDEGTKGRFVDQELRVLMNASSDSSIGYSFFLAYAHLEPFHFHRVRSKLTTASSTVFFSSPHESRKVATSSRSFSLT